MAESHRCEACSCSSKNSPHIKVVTASAQGQSLQVRVLVLTRVVVLHRTPGKFQRGSWCVSTSAGSRCRVYLSNDECMLMSNKNQKTKLHVASLPSAYNECPHLSIIRGVLPSLHSTLSPHPTPARPTLRQTSITITLLHLAGEPLLIARQVHEHPPPGQMSGAHSSVGEGMNR